MASRTAELESRLPVDFPYRDLWKPIALLVGGVLPLVIVVWFPSTWTASWAVVAPAALLLAIIAVMLWPSAGTNRYLAYKTPLFIFTIVFELWILLAGPALHLPSTVQGANLWFQLVLVGFFLGTAAISLPGVEGEYRPGIFFRPDLLYGNGAYLARGEIFVALGIKLLTTGEVAHPIWNWWGLQWALAAMVFMVPFRGMLKMRMRRARFLDMDNWMGRGIRPGLWLKEGFLFLSLLLLVYGFANVYMGKTPFTWTPGHPMPQSTGPGWWGLAFLAAALVLIVPIRGWYKTRLAEPAPFRQDLVKGLMLWLGFGLLIYGFLQFFQGTGWPHFYGPSSPNFWWGVWISVLGFLMIVPLRAFAQRQEFMGILRIMIPRMADLPEEQRRLMMGRRLEIIAAMPEEPRRENVALMMRLIGELPERPRQELVKTRTWLVASAPEEQRGRLMEAMAATLAGMERSERIAAMSEVMGSVAELPDENRKVMMAAMSELMGG